MSNALNSITTRVEGQEIIFERIFDAPRELVFKVFKEPKHLSKWWGPKGWTLPVCNIDFRPGGVWHYCMKCIDENQGEFYGQESWGKGIYQEIVEPEKIIYLDSFSDAEGNSVKSLPEGLITLTFEEYEGKTKLVSRAKYGTEEEVKSLQDMGLVEGLTQTWDRLAELLEDLK